MAIIEKLHRLDWTIMRCRPKTCLIWLTFELECAFYPMFCRLFHALRFHNDRQKRLQKGKEMIFPKTTNIIIEIKNKFQLKYFFEPHCHFFMFSTASWHQCVLESTSPAPPPPYIKKNKTKIIWLGFPSRMFWARGALLPVGPHMHQLYNRNNPRKQVIFKTLLK